MLQMIPRSSQLLCRWGGASYLSNRFRRTESCNNYYSEHSILPTSLLVAHQDESSSGANDRTVNIFLFADETMGRPSPNLPTKNSTKQTAPQKLNDECPEGKLIRASISISSPLVQSNDSLSNPHMA